MRKVLPYTSGQTDRPTHFCGMITGFFSEINQTTHVVEVRKG